MKFDIDPAALDAVALAHELDAEARAFAVADELDARGARFWVCRPDSTNASGKLWSYSCELEDAMDWGDLDAAGYILGAQHRTLELYEKMLDAAKPSGLVSVPTSVRTPLRRLNRTLCAIEVKKALDSIGGFLIDKESRRLATLRRSVGFAARANNVSSKATAGEECLMVTLTYRGTNDDWSPRDIAAYMKKVRSWLAARDLGCRYVWVAELQGRGVIHYHVALWVPKGVRLPFPDHTYRGRDGRDRPAMWPHGMSRIEVARAAVPYLLKYLSKQTSKTFGEFPRGARIYGVGGLDHSMRRARRWLGLPSFVQANSSIHDRWIRAPREYGLSRPECYGSETIVQRKGGWLSPSGEHFPSEFQRIKIAGQDALKRVHTHARAIEADGPFSWMSDKPRAREVWGFACET